MDKIEKYYNSPLIKVIIGQRRVWKSTILKSIIQSLIKSKNIPISNFFYINKELLEFDNITNYTLLSERFKIFLQTITPGKIFVGVDEIQSIMGREKFINSILAQYQNTIEIVITGSNSTFLSSKLATLLTWRYIEFHIYPLSFDEFCIFKKDEATKKNFLEYIKYGWLPAIFSMHYEDNPIFSYLSGVYNTIIVKDIIEYYNIRNVSFFKDLYKYVLANIWNIISAKAIKDYLKSQQIVLWNDTVANFLEYAMDTFLLYKVYSVNPDTKKNFEIYNKYYVGDIWLRNALVWYDFKKDIGKLLENYVFLELKRNNYSITIGRFSNGKEVDFIAERNGFIKYFQVCYLLWGEDAMEREYSSLEQIKDNWPKYIVSFDDIPHGIHNGIEHIHVMNLQDKIA